VPRTRRQPDNCTLATRVRQTRCQGAPRGLWRALASRPLRWVTQWKRQTPPTAPHCPSFAFAGPWRSIPEAPEQRPRGQRGPAKHPHHFKQRDTTFDTTASIGAKRNGRKTAISSAKLVLSLRRGPKAVLFKGNHAKMYLRHEPVAPARRLTCCMKKILLLSAVLLGAVTASQAGVRVNIGIGIPLPGLVISQPAPVFVAPAPVYAPPPAVAVAPPVVVAPPIAYYGYRPGWYGWHGRAHPYGWGRRW
jgi:hypothetical protein